ncbi:DNA-3-methyladenine glycosylase [Candidatus Bathyarchaeota archaeon]|nr:DNA-3-methyladenine glycosylase [Candidatus Bathyarchaeota archaeon]
MTSIFKRIFFQRDPENVALDLLGTKLVRKFDLQIFEGMIVETEAYYGEKDPASRAYNGLKFYNKAMWSLPGNLFIYNVHKYWMFNIVAHYPNEVGAVLIRAVEPLTGIEEMMKNRQIDDIYQLTKGPGKLTIAFNIDNSLNEIDITSEKSRIHIVKYKTDFKIASSKRIGVKKDLKRNMRFFIDSNRYVSK